MSNVFFDRQWEQAIQELIQILELEVPSASYPGPQNLVDYSRVYLRYLQAYKMLEDCFHQMVHPQKRIDCKRSLEAVVGRILEIKNWMISLNAGKEFINFEDILLSSDMSPDSLDVVPPKLLTADNARNLETREKFLSRVLQSEEIQSSAPERNKRYPVYTKEQAIQILQANERGRQARLRLDNIAKTRFLQEEALKKQQAGHEPLTPERATLVMQAAARGFLARCRVKHSAEDEATLLEMNVYERNSDRDYAFGFMRETELRRKKAQLLTQQEYLDAMFLAKEQIKELEGQEMREIIQDKISAWLSANRDPGTGLFPPFPKPADGGSKFIVHPPPKLDFEVENKKKKDAKGGDDKKKKKPKAGPFPPLVLPVDDEEKPPSCPAFFLRHVRESVEIYLRTWHDKDDSFNLAQTHSTDLLKAQMRPAVFEEIRLEVDQNTRVILDRVKKKILAELKAARKKQKKDGKEKKKEKKKDKDDAPAAPAKKKGKKPKDPTAQRTIESIYSELAKNGIVQLIPKRDLSEYVASDTFYGPNAEVDQALGPTTAQVKRLVVEYCILPLISDFVHEHAPFIKSVLLYGGESNGKTLLVHAATRAAGATFFNLSPEVTDGKYPGKMGAKMLQMVFKLARIMAPSVVHFSGVEKLFVTDKKKIKAYGYKDKPNRLKKAIMKEVKALKPGERVLFLGTSSRPVDAPKKPVFPNFFTKRIYVPYPDYGARSRVWRALMERHGGVVTEHFNLSLISQLSEGFSVGSIEKICKTVLTEKRKRKLRRFPMTIKEVIPDLHNTKPVDPAFHQALREWAKPKVPTTADKWKGKGKDAKKKGKAK